MREIVKYSNRKLYDRTLRKHIILSDVAQYIANGEELKIIEKTTGKDITYNTLVRVLSNKLSKTLRKSQQNVISMIETI